MHQDITPKSPRYKLDGKKKQEKTTSLKWSIYIFIQAGSTSFVHTLTWDPSTPYIQFKMLLRG